MKRTASLVLLLLWPLLAAAQDVSLPTTINCKPGRMVKITAVAAPGMSVFWDTGGLTPGVEFDFIKLDATSAIMLFPAELPQGSYKIGALVATDKNKISMAYTTVVVGAPAPPVPPPGPTPVPVPSQLAQDLATALAKDGKTAASLDACKKVAAVARILADKGKSDTTLKTAGDVFTLWAASVKNILAPTDIPAVRATVGAYLNGRLPLTPSAPLTDQVRQTMAAEFTTLAITLEALK